ncbi:MAG: hypothetical protein WCG04_07050, partial [Alphaproteobacteria bacterium]
QSTERKSKMSNGHIAQMGKGVLFMNEKRTSDKSPDWKGTILLSEDYKAGQVVKLAGWTKNTPKGQLISLSEDNWKPPTQNAGTYPREVNDNDVPF